MSRDPLIGHYEGVLQLIERLCMAKVPKMFRTSGLTECEKSLIALELARSHYIAEELFNRRYDEGDAA